MNAILRMGLSVAVAAIAFSASAVVAEPRVVVTIKPIHALVAGIMKGVATPELLIDGSTSPHSFTLKPSAAKAINQADIFVRVSEILEPFTVRLSRSLPKTVHLITLDQIPGLTLRNRRDGATFETHNHHGSASRRDRNTADPTINRINSDAHQRDGHIWLDPENAKMIVRELASALSIQSPHHAATYKVNADEVVASINRATIGIAQILEPVSGIPFVVFHDAYQYFEKRFGLDAVGSITINPESKPSAKRLTELRQKINSLDVVCVFAEPMFQPKLVDAVIEGTKARAGTLDPEGLTVQAGEDAYVALMTKLAINLASCLSPSPTTRAELPSSSLNQ